MPSIPIQFIHLNLGNKQDAELQFKFECKNIHLKLFEMNKKKLAKLRLDR